MHNHFGQRLLFGIVSLVITALLFAAASAQVTGGTQIMFAVDPAVEFNANDVRAAAQVIARRLAALELDYLVQVVDGNTIQVQFAGADDPSQVMTTLSQTALLELVDFSGLASKASELVGSTIITTAQAASDYPAGEGHPNPLTGAPFDTILTGAAFRTASAIVSQTSAEIWEISFQLTDEAGEVFGAYTEAHVGEPIAIVLDGLVLSAPVVHTRLDKDGVITGNFTRLEAEALAAQLRAGALPLPLTLQSVSSFETIEPEVGTDS